MTNGNTHGIEHVFVLMLENRSFDHMLGFSNLEGFDAVTGAPTRANGLAGGESNTFDGKTYPVTRGADWVMPADPPHQFTDMVHQLCGPAATYPRGGAYPPINDSGYVATYAGGGGAANPGEIMKCFTADQLPVLNALAREFVVCDNWYAPMPGPTWPNRMFVHAASSNGLDHSPSNLEIADWETLGSFSFLNGTIFDALHKKGITRRLYAGDDFPMVAALHGIRLTDIRHYSLFAGDLGEAQYPFTYVFIEPSYNVLDDYRNSTSQHPLADVRRGEALIKATYESIRNSKFWNSSMLVITWDENGGFFDHTIPPAAVAPGDSGPDSKFNQSGFTFEQYGPRVPAVVVSPLIPPNQVDHRVYDHASVPATLEDLFGLEPLTNRDATANRLSALVSLATARDAPKTLPAAALGLSEAPQMGLTSTPAVGAQGISRPADTVNDGTLPGILHSAMNQDIQASPPEQRQLIIDRVRSIRTRAEAMEYLRQVQAKVDPLKAGNPGH